MSRTGWKQVERDAAAHFGATRFPANTGGPLDFAGPRYVGQVKNPKTMSLAALEALAVRVAILGDAREKSGVVVVKRSAGAGQPTPLLVVMTMAVWDEIARRSA